MQSRRTPALSTGGYGAVSGVLTGSATNREVGQEYAAKGRVLGLPEFVD